MSCIFNMIIRNENFFNTFYGTQITNNLIVYLSHVCYLSLDIKLLLCEPVSKSLAGEFYIIIRYIRSF